MQASLSHFGPWANHGASPLGIYFWVYEGEEGYWDQSTCLINLTVSCDRTSGSVDKGKAGDVIYLDFSKASGTMSLNIMVPKLGYYSLGGCATK